MDNQSSPLPIIGMATDSLMGRGCDTREAFTANLRRIAGAIDDLHKPVSERGITVRHDE